MEVNMEEQKSNRRAILGIILILAGMIIIAAHFQWIPWSLKGIIFSWQALLILIGLFFLFSRDNKVAGVILIAVGAFFMIPDVWDISFEWKKLILPFILVALGLIIITRRRSIRIPSEDSIDYIDDMALFGGGDRVITSQNFKGGRITAMFGGSKINLLKANLAKGRNVIDIFTVFGGSKLIVPSDWDIKIEVTSIFGGFSDKRMVSKDDIRDPSRDLIIKGMAIFGGGDIVSF